MPPFGDPLNPSQGAHELSYVAQKVALLEHVGGVVVGTGGVGDGVGIRDGFEVAVDDGVCVGGGAGVGEGVGLADGIGVGVGVGVGAGDGVCVGAVDGAAG